LSDFLPSGHDGIDKITIPDGIPGEHAVLSVNDNGCGMDGDITDKILETFLSTQGVVQGTEPGLPIVFFALAQ